MAYATKAAYKVVYDTSVTDARLEAYLGRASRKIDAALSSRGASVSESPSSELSQALEDVCIDMTHRVLGDSGSDADYPLPDGITSYSQSAGGLTESFGWPSPYTDMQIRDDELNMLLGLLGIDTSGVGTFRMWGDPS